MAPPSPPSCPPPPRRRRWLPAALAALALAGCAAAPVARAPAPSPPAPPPGKRPALRPPPAEKRPAPAPPPPPASSPLLERADALSAKGERAYRQENYPAAERHFREALGLIPDHLYALTGLGWTLYDDGRFAEAYAYFRRAREKSPNDGSARRGLGYLLYRFGRKWEARVFLGTLDRDRWPELANIDDELRERALRGLPPPRLPEGPPLKVPPVKVPPAPRKTGRPEKAGKPKGAPPARPAPGGTPPRAARPSGDLPPPEAQRPSFRNMVLIPGGVYLMGEIPSDGALPRRSRRGRRRAIAAARPSPGRRVEVRTFRLDKFEVTNALYAAFVRAAGRPAPPFWRKPHFAGPHLPVVGVTWEEARAYCAWAGKRLPTEAEWEYAARGGGERQPYPWGRKFEERNAIYGLPPDRGGPKAVGRRPHGASPHGVEDLAGNVWEWVEDPYRRSLGDPAPLRRGEKVLRTLRGGSWVNGRWALAATSRTGDVPDKRLPVYGFRCAADAP